MSITFTKIKRVQYCIVCDVHNQCQTLSHLCLHRLLSRMTDEEDSVSSLHLACVVAV